MRLIGDSLDESFVAAVRLIRMAQGKVVTVGVGTSGPVARRMAHLLSTSGTPSLFLHPGDALHGGLGAITAADVVLAISKGGGSAELNEFIRLAKTRGAALLVLTARGRSPLARQRTWRWFFRKRRTQIRAASSRWGRAWRRRRGGCVGNRLDADQWLQLGPGHRRPPVGAVGQREQLPAALSRLPDPAAPASNR